MHSLEGGSNGTHTKTLLAAYSSPESCGLGHLQWALHPSTASAVPKAKAQSAAPTANQRGVSAFRKKCMDKIHVRHWHLQRIHRNYLSMQVAKDTFSNVKRSTCCLQKNLGHVSTYWGDVMEINLYIALPISSGRILQRCKMKLEQMYCTHFSRVPMSEFSSFLGVGLPLDSRPLLPLLSCNKHRC